MVEEPSKEPVKEVPKKKKKKKKEVEKSKLEEQSQLKVPKQTKPPIAKAKEKNETKKSSVKEPSEKLSKKEHAKKKTEKIALWAESLNHLKKTNSKTKVPNKVVGPVKPTNSNNKETNSTKTAKKVTDIIEKKTSLGTIKKIPKVPKKPLDTSNNSVVKDVKRVRRTSFNENPFAKKIENITNNASQEKEQSVFAKNENPFLNSNQNASQPYQQQPKNAGAHPNSTKSTEEVVHFDVEDMQEDENYKNEVQQVAHSSSPLIKTPPRYDDAGHQINVNFSQEQLEHNSVVFEQQIQQQQWHQHSGANIINNAPEEENMEVDDASKFSHEIMKEVGMEIWYHLHY